MEPESNKSAETPPVSNPQTEAVEEEASNNLNEANGAENSEGNDGDFILRAEFFQNEDTLDQLETLLVENIQPSVQHLKRNFRDLKDLIEEEVDQELKKFNEKQDIASFFQNKSNNHDIFLLKAHRLMDLFKSKKKSVFIEGFDENNPKHTAGLKETRGNSLDIYDLSDDTLTLAFPGQMVVLVRNDEKAIQFRTEIDPEAPNTIFPLFAHFPLDVFKYQLAPYLTCRELFLIRGVCRAWKQTIGEIWFRNFKQEFKYTEQAEFYSKQITSQYPNLKLISPFMKYLLGFSGQLVEQIDWEGFIRAAENDIVSETTSRLLLVLIRLIFFDKEELKDLNSYATIVNMSPSIQNSFLRKYLPDLEEQIMEMRESLGRNTVDIPSIGFLQDFKNYILSTPDLAMNHLAKEDNAVELQKTKLLTNQLQFLFVLYDMMYYMNTYLLVCKDRKEQALAKSIHSKSPDNLLKVMLFRSVKFANGKIELDNSVYSENLLSKALEQTVGFQTGIVSTIKTIIDLISSKPTGQISMEDIESIMPQEEFDEEGNLKPDKETVDETGTTIRVFVDLEFKRKMVMQSLMMCYMANEFKKLKENLRKIEDEEQEEQENVEEDAKSKELPEFFSVYSGKGKETEIKEHEGEEMNEAGVFFGGGNQSIFQRDTENNSKMEEESKQDKMEEENDSGRMEEESLSQRTTEKKSQSDSPQRKMEEEGEKEEEEESESPGVYSFDPSWL